MAWGRCVQGLLQSSCCEPLLWGTAIARLFPPSAEPSTFIFVFPSLIGSTLPLESNERAELKQTQSVRGGLGEDVWGHCRGAMGSSWYPHAQPREVW